MMVTGMLEKSKRSIKRKRYQSFYFILFILLSILIGSSQGFRPICIYGRKARQPLTGELDPHGNELKRRTM